MVNMKTHFPPLSTKFISFLDFLCKNHMPKILKRILIKHFFKTVRIRIRYTVKNVCLQILKQPFYIYLLQ